MAAALLAGAAVMDITPTDSQFLYGYPHVSRYSTGVHDPLLCSGLCLDDGQKQILFLTTDIIFISKALCRTVRQDISARIGIAPENILLSASHTHSGPITVNYVSNSQDAVVPPADEAYLRFLQERIIATAQLAWQNRQEAKAGLVTADSTGIGSNRHDPAGPADHEVPVLLIKANRDDANIACMLICSMHPTVLHEDSTLISADFPGMARRYLQTQLLGDSCPVLYHTGPAGNTSPRHVTSANTFAEAERLGRILAEAVMRVVPGMDFSTDLPLELVRAEIDLPRKVFPSLATAQVILLSARKKLELLCAEQAAKQAIRTAECDWFGAEETLALAQAAAEGRLEEAYASCLPAEIQIFKVGPWRFVGWQGEVFVEYALAVKKAFAHTYLISLANGELQGYLATAEAAAGGSYESANALFSPTAGQVLVDTTIRLLKELVPNE